MGNLAGQKEGTCIRALLWDIDNTLLDFPAAERTAVRRGFAEFGLGVCTDEMLAAYSTINRSYWERLERGELSKPEVLEGRFVEFFRRYGLPTDSVAAFNERFQILLGETVCFFDEGDAVVRGLQGKLLQCAVTNGTETAQVRKLANSGLDQLLDLVFISDRVGAEKPSSAFFDAVLREADAWLAAHEEELAAGVYRGPLRRDEVMIVGDSLTSDMRGGNNAGILCCWYNPEGLANTQGVRVDVEIRDLREVPRILKGE